MSRRPASWAIDRAPAPAKAPAKTASHAVIRAAAYPCIGKVSSNERVSRRRHKHLDMIVKSVP
ncbi:hypothetical protein GCM10007242_03800 [Pigmentiphaga litoralis]|nr:hypothetical protein GCM10007242_03800 [Pigmentiphaga litoralis]